MQYRAGPVVEFCNDVKWPHLRSIYQILLNTCLLDDGCALSYKSARREMFYVTGRSPFAHKFGMIRVIRTGDDQLLAIGSDLPNPLTNTYGLMYQVLAGVLATFTIDGLAKAPAVSHVVEPGTEQHAREVCANMEEIRHDIFGVRDGDYTHIAICVDAIPSEVHELFDQCEASKVKLSNQLDLAHSIHE